MGKVLHDTAADRAAAERDPHLRLPKSLRAARIAEAVFIVVTAYVAMSLPLGGTEAGRMIRARLVLEAGVALAVMMGLSRRPRPSRIAAIVLAAYVLLGCIPHLGRAVAALGDGAGALEALALLLNLAACGSQLVVLFACTWARLADEEAVATGRARP